MLYTKFLSIFSSDISQQVILHGRHVFSLIRMIFNKCLLKSFVLFGLAISEEKMEM